MRLAGSECLDAHWRYPHLAYAERVASRRRQIEYPAPYIWTSIVDANHDRLARFEIGHA
jgi:hypothetical protein